MSKPPWISHTNTEYGTVSGRFQTLITTNWVRRRAFGQRCFDAPVFRLPTNFLAFLFGKRIQELPHLETICLNYR